MVSPFVRPAHLQGPQNEWEYKRKTVAEAAALKTSIKGAQIHRLQNHHVRRDRLNGILGIERRFLYSQWRIMSRLIVAEEEE